MTYLGGVSTFKSLPYSWETRKLKQFHLHMNNKSLLVFYALSTKCSVYWMCVKYWLPFFLSVQFTAVNNTLLCMFLSRQITQNFIFSKLVSGTVNLVWLEKFSFSLQMLSAFEYSMLLFVSSLFIYFTLSQLQNDRIEFSEHRQNRLSFEGTWQFKC